MVGTTYTDDELFSFLMQSATKANFRRFQSIELEKYFFDRVKRWRKIEERSIQSMNKTKQGNHNFNDEWQH